METRWIGKNVDLDLVVKEIRKFFEDRSFQVFSKESAEEILVFARKGDNSNLSLIVKVKGIPNNFSVEFKENKLDFPAYFFSLLSLIGAGALVSKWMKKAETYQKIECEFWNFMDQKVSELAGSA